MIRVESAFEMKYGEEAGMRVSGYELPSRMHAHGSLKPDLAQQKRGPPAWMALSAFRLIPRR